MRRPLAICRVSPQRYAVIQRSGRDEHGDYWEVVSAPSTDRAAVEADLRKLREYRGGKTK